MSNYIEIVNTWGQQRINAILQEYESKGLKASGDFGRSLEFRTTQIKGINIKFFAANHSEFMLKGRQPNKNQSPEKLKAWVGWAGSTILREWVKNKRLSLNPYAVAWSIARKGVKVPSRFNDGKLLENALSDESIKDLFNQLGGAFTIELKSKYIKEWQ